MALVQGRAVTVMGLFAALAIMGSEPLAEGHHGFLVDGHEVFIGEAVRVLWPTDPGGFSTWAMQKRSNAIHDAEQPSVVAPRPKSDQSMAERIRLIVIGSDLSSSVTQGFRAFAFAGWPAHFHIDFDGVIYQPMDLADARYPVAGDARLLADSAIEINLTNPLDDSAPYLPSRERHGDQATHPRPGPFTAEIHGKARTTFGFTDAQYASLNALLQVLHAQFPRTRGGLICDAGGGIVRTIDPRWQAHEGVLPAWAIDKRFFYPGPAFEWNRVEGLACRTSP